MATATIAKPDFTTARRLLAEGLGSDKEIQAKTGVKQGTLRVWRSRLRVASGIPVKLEKPAPVAKQAVTVDSLRGDLAEVAKAQVAILQKFKPRSYASLSGRDGHAATLKTIVESVAKIESWDAQDGLKLNLGLLSSFKLPEAISGVSKPVD